MKHPNRKPRRGQETAPQPQDHKHTQRALEAPRAIALRAVRGKDGAA